MLVEFDYYKSKAVVEMTPEGLIKSVKSITNPAGDEISRIVVREPVHMKRLTIKAREAMKVKNDKAN